MDEFQTTPRSSQRSTLINSTRTSSAGDAHSTESRCRTFPRAPTASGDDASPREGASSRDHQTGPGARVHPAAGSIPAALALAAMTLWTFTQSVLLVLNAFAILNERRFLEKVGLGQSGIHSGYVSSTSPRGQLIGLITATSYMRSASRRRSSVASVLRRARGPAPPAPRRRRRRRRL